jgi:hypothetical protein
MLSRLFRKKTQEGVEADLTVRLASLARKAQLSWEAQRKSQLSNRQTAGFLPVPEECLDKFNGPGEIPPTR